MNNDKAIKLYKKNFFLKIRDFIKGLFNKNKKELEIIEQKVDKKVNCASSQFLESIKLNHKDVEPTELQIKFENKEIDFASMSDEEVHSLNVLYKKQVEDLKKKIDNKKTELNMLNFKTTNKLTNL